MAKRGIGRPVTKVTWAETFRDVLVASINKGQFPLAVAAMIVMVVLWRMPQADVGRLAFDTLDRLRRGYLVGYLLAGLLTAAWFIHARHLRRASANELRRVTAERTRAQEQKLGARLQSSEKKK